VAATQGPNGVIHVVTSRAATHLHIELNEAWVLSQEATSVPLVKIRPDTVKSHREAFADGKTRVTWSAGVGDDGEYLLHGTQVFFYEKGHKQWETTFDAGCRIGTETYWAESGQKQWERIHSADGSSTWRIFDGKGQLAAESDWRGKNLVKFHIAGR
jgi:hypothetical protein